MTVYQAYKQAINEHWIGGLVSPKYLEASLHRVDGKKGWNGWCSRSLLVIDHENGLPGPLETEEIPEIRSMDYFSDEWCAINKRASELLGRKVYIEPYNNAVTGVYYA